MSDDAQKTAVKIAGRPFAKGADPRRGHGVKGRSGRPPNEYREFLRKVLDDAKVSKAVKDILKDPDHRQFARVYATVVAQAHGNPVQPITVDAEDLPSFKVECE